MNDLVDWLGNVDDSSISYDVGIYKTPLLAEGAFSESDNYRGVIDVTWENTVSKANRRDYMLAICSGTISGLIDVFYVGEISLERANTWGSVEINKFVMKMAEMQGFKGKDLTAAIKYLEDNYGFAADSVASDFGSGLQHHLRDFSHHFSLGGWLCSLFTQFTGKVIGTDTKGALLIVDLKEKSFIGTNFEEKILFGTVNWFFHIVSDMAGSSANAGKGTGIPGPLLSLIKELSMLPCFKDKKIGEREFHVWVSALFNGTLLAKRDENGKIIETVRFNLRTEIGILHEVGRQFVPILINECLVRGLYFLRRLYIALKETEIHSIADFKRINAYELLPFNNRVIKRMTTIASGTFTVIDMADATVYAAIKRKGTNHKFFANFAVRINIVGVGRFIVACKADGRFITEDIRKAKIERNKSAIEYEKLIADLKCLSLTYDQMRVLASLERLIIEDDIIITKRENDKTLKTEWKIEWEDKLTEGMSVVSDAKAFFFIPEAGVIRYIKENDEGPWLYLLAMESMLFSPYYAIFGDTEKDNAVKKLKCKSTYLTDKFTTLQDKLSKDDFTKLQKAYKRAIGIVTGSKKNAVIGAVGTTAAAAATGGLAFAFAPVIATALVGEAAAGLSGAALVSYSLAAIGGGSLAAGGLGMAGGTAAITGGGALVGILGGTGISAATTVNLLSDEGYVLSECCKLITFSDAILMGRYDDIFTVADIWRKVKSRISEVQKQINTFLAQVETERDEQKKKEMIIKIRVAKKSMKYLDRTAGELRKIAR